MDKKYNGEKRVFEKHKQRLYKNGQETSLKKHKQFPYENRVGRLEGWLMLSPYREWIKSIREKNEFLKNISKDYIKMGKNIKVLR